MKTFRPKIIDVFKNYSKKQLISDLVAGLIVAIIALPLSIALAIASGVSPEKGLYTAIVAGFVIALLGGSRVNISGPTAAFAAIAIVGGKGDEPAEFCAPCGVCRQVMAEFCKSDFRLVLGNENALQIRTLGELFPDSFSPADL